MKLRGSSSAYWHSKLECLSQADVENCPFCENFGVAENTGGEAGNVTSDVENIGGEALGNIDKISWSRSQH
ncbi:hypothetical protein P8452_37850 [Trifolium repens]|nr:hypothetical protein P8452_37850 [Trifolium repens]